MQISSKELPNGKHTVTPYIIVKDAAGFIDFLKQAFDAHEFGRTENPDGTIGHAEVRVGDTTLMIVDGKKEWRDTPARSADPRRCEAGSDRVSSPRTSGAARTLTSP